jgi:hypothetical protein
MTAANIISPNNNIKGQKDMSIFNALKTHLTAKKQSTMERYVELLGRADAPNDGDAEALVSMMETLNLTVEQVQDDAAIVKEVRELSPHILDADNRSQQAWEAKKVSEGWDAETFKMIENIKLERGPKSYELSQRKQLAESRLSQSANARKRVGNDMIFKYLRLYPNDPLNLKS